MLKKIKVAGLVCLLGMSVSSVVAQDNVIDEVVWIVGDDAILKSEVEEQYRNLQYEGQRIDGDPYCVIPEQLAIQKLFLHQAKLDSISISDSQVLQQVEARLNYFIANIGSKEKVEEYFNKSITQIREELTDMVREQGTVQEMQRHLVKDIKITPSEVRRYYSTLPEDSIPYIPTQVEVQVITINPKIPQQEIDNIKARLREYSDRVMKGDADFSTLAIMYSQDSGSARMGGELGFMGRGSLVPEYANVAFNLTDPKKVSKIVETEFGYHIIQLIEKRGDRINTRHILLKPEVAQKDRNDAIARLDSVRADITSGKFSFEEAAMYISQDKDTRNNNGLMMNPENGTTKFEMQALPQEIAKMVDGMAVGDISVPFTMINQSKGKEVVAIVKLKSRTEGHKANLSDDYQALKNIVEMVKQNELIEDWIKKKQKETYIRIKEGWRNCEFRYDGWVKQ
ncbi:MAG: peptidylprolyl isomerase [Coprobacter sp.]|nr:peptidylprolyl isomerase [Coprobacter sp.]